LIRRAGELEGIGAHRPHLSRLVIDKFMTGGGRTVVSQLSFLVASAIFAASGRTSTKYTK
jgi:hypothetical protein